MREIRMEVDSHTDWEYRCQKAEALVAAYLSQVESYRRELSAANAELASRPSEIVELEKEVASLRMQLSMLQKRYDSQQEVVLLGEQYIVGLKTKAASHEAELAAQAQKLLALEEHASQVVNEYEVELADLQAQLAAAQLELKVQARSRLPAEASDVTTCSVDKRARSSEPQPIEEEEEEAKGSAHEGSEIVIMEESVPGNHPPPSSEPHVIPGPSLGGSQEATASPDGYLQRNHDTPPRSKSSKSGSGSLISTSTGFFSSVSHPMSVHHPQTQSGRLAGQQPGSGSGGLAFGQALDPPFSRSGSLMRRNSGGSDSSVRGSPKSPTFKIAYTPGIGCVISLSGHTAWVRTLCLAPSGTLWSGSSDRSIRAWKDGACAATLPGASKYQYRNKATDGHRESVYALVIGPDGILWSGSGDKTIKGWLDTTCVATLTGHQGTVAALAVAEDGTLYSGSYDKTVKVWRQNACVATMRAHKDFVTCLALGPDGDLWSGSSDMTIKRWRGGQYAATLAGHREEVFALAFGPDGTLWSASGDHSVKGWRGKECVITLVGHRDWVLSVAVGPNGMIWSGSKDHTIRGWINGECVVIHEGHGNWVECLAVAPDGTLWSGSWDKTIKGWR